MKAAALAFLVTWAAGAQSPSVLESRVRAHEDFLAGDALQGRGGATRDERIAAEYVASEFESYGLKGVPYIQRVELETTRLNGKAELRIGRRAFHEGPDFYILSSSGASVSGKLQIVKLAGLKEAKPAKDTAVLIRGQPARRDLNSLRGPRLTLIEDSPDLREVFAMMGSQARVPTTIKGLPAETAPPPSALVVLKAPAVKLLRNARDGRAATLTIGSAHELKFTYNAMGMLPGRDPADGTILITAHLDHLGIGRPVDGDSIYNGANDDASGVTAVLEIARALAAGARLRRNVLFVCFGSEEIGGFGARWFREKPPVPLKDIAANLEFEMIGVQEAKVPAGTMFLTGWERSNFGPAMKEHGARLSPDPFPEKNFFQRSDNYALALRGVVAHTAAAGGEVPTYHKPNDDVAHIDIALMAELIQSMIEPLRWLADSDFKPEWNKGGQPAPGR